MEETAVEHPNFIPDRDETTAAATIGSITSASYRRLPGATVVNDDSDEDEVADLVLVLQNTSEDAGTEQEVDTTFVARLGLTLYGHGLFLQSLLLFDAVSFCLLVILLHAESSIKTVTCNSRGRPLEVQDYVCEHRGTFNVAWSLFAEALFTIVAGCLMVKHTIKVSKSLNSTYLLWKCVFVVTAILHANVINTLNGLYMQSTYVYSVLCIATLFFVPPVSAKNLPVVFMVSVFAFLSSILPLCTVMTSPATPSKDLDGFAAALGAVHVIYLTFIAVWGSVAKTCQFKYKLDVWIYVGVSIAYRIFVRVLATIALLRA